MTQPSTDGPGPMGRGLVISSVAAALLQHHLISQGQDISLLPQALARIVAGRSLGRPCDWEVAITNDAGYAEHLGIARTRFVIDYLRTLRLPPLAMTLRSYTGEDPVMRITDMGIGADTSYCEWTGRRQLALTRRLPETIVESARGRRLAEVVSHPVLDGMPLRIDEAWNPADAEPGSVRESQRIGAVITVSPVVDIVLPWE